MVDKLPSIYVVGDSHVRDWEYLGKNRLSTKLNVLGGNRKPAKTAYYLSKQENINLLLQPALNQSEYIDYLGIYLGEVDCGASLWNHKFNTLEYRLNIATDNLINFADHVLTYKNKIGNVILMGPIIPLLQDYKTIPWLSQLRRQVDANCKQRTELTLEFCSNLKAKCKLKNYLYLDINDLLVDKTTKIVKEEILKKYADKNHLLLPHGAKLWLKRIENKIKENKK